MNKKIFSLIAALLFLFGAILFYVNTVLAPPRLKNLTLGAMTEYLGRKVTLNNAYFHPLHGLVIQNLNIYEQNSPDIFANIQQVHIGILIWPLVREGKLVLSSIDVHKLRAQLIHYTGDQWNFTGILKPASTHSRHKSPILCSRISIKDSAIKLISLQADNQFSELFDHINLTAGFSLRKGITFHGHFTLPDQKGRLEASGNYRLKDKKIKGALKAENIVINPYIQWINPVLPFTLNRSHLKNANLLFEWNTTSMRIKGDWDIHAFSAQNQFHSLEARLLSARKTDITIKTSAPDMKGQITAHAIKYKSQWGAFSADDINGTIDQFTLNNDQLIARGNMAVHKGFIQIPQWPLIQGDAVIKNAHISSQNQHLKSQIDVQFKNALVKWPTEKHLSGNFSSANLTSIIDDNTAIFKGDIHMENFMYQWADQKNFSGQLLLEQASLVCDKAKQCAARTKTRSNSLKLQLPNHRSLSAQWLGSTVFNFSWIDNSWLMHNEFKLSQAIFKINKTLSLTGQPSGILKIYPGEDAFKSAAYQGVLNFQDEQLSGTPIGSITNIQGKTEFKNNFASTSGLTFNALGMAANIVGEIENFADPLLNVTIQTDSFDLSATPRIVPALLIHQIFLQGYADNVVIHYQGLLNSIKEADIRFTGHVKNATIISKKINQSASAVTGLVDYKNHTLGWKELQAQHNNQAYQLTGHLREFDNPIVETTIKSQNLDVTTHFQYTTKSLLFSKLYGRYHNILFDLKGSAENSTHTNPYFKLSGWIELNLEDLPAIVPGVRSIFQAGQPEGTIQARGDFQGDAVHWQDWSFNLTGSSPMFSIKGLQIKNMKFNAVSKNNLIKPFHMWGEFYQGDFNAFLSVDTAKNELPFDLVTRVLDSKLKLLKDDTPLKKIDLAGDISSTIFLNGSLMNLANIHGKGGLEIKEGRLWEIDLLKGLGGILLIPEYKDIIFTQAGMNFELKEGVLSTDNLQLISSSLSLFGKGTLDFKSNQTLRLTLNPDFNARVIAGSSSLKKGTTAIITQTEKFMSIDVTGNLSNPKYKVNKSPVRILQKTGGVILENVSQLFQSIF